VGVARFGREPDLDRDRELADVLRSGAAAVAPSRRCARARSSVRSSMSK